MSGALLISRGADDKAREDDYDLAYYRSLTTAERFRMTIERSIQLLELARRHAKYTRSPPLVKRR